MTDTSLPQEFSTLNSGAILRHKGENYYQVLGKTGIRTPEGWVDGLVYFKVEKEKNCFVIEYGEGTGLFTRPVSLFGKNWEIIREGYTESF